MAVSITDRSDESETTRGPRATTRIKSVSVADKAIVLSKRSCAGPSSAFGSFLAGLEAFSGPYLPSEAPEKL